MVLRPGDVSWFLGFSLLVKCSCDQTVRAAIIDHKYQTLEFNSELTLATDLFSSSPQAFDNSSNDIWMVL